MEGCVFDDSDKLAERVIIKKDGWYAFVPDEPEIFGHIIVTVETPCIREVACSDKRIPDVLKIMSSGIKFIADLLTEVKDVQRVYIAMLGETDSVHMHCHIIPRYGFVNDSEIAEWAKENRLTKGLLDWQRFYSNPTANFKISDGFRYLGEVENSYNIAKKRIGTKPSIELVKQMAGKIKDMLKKA